MDKSGRTSNARIQARAGRARLRFQRGIPRRPGFYFLKKPDLRFRSPCPRMTDLKKQIAHDRRPFTHDDENLAGQRVEKTKPGGERTAKTRLAPSDFRKKPALWCNTRCLWRLGPKKPNRCGPRLRLRLTGIEKTNLLRWRYSGALPFALEQPEEEFVLWNAIDDVVFANSRPQ
jgi:hypothetical protein